MKRREFFGVVFGGAVAAFLPKPKVSLESLWNMHPAQKAFMEQEVPITLMGIPYHQSNAHIGTWLGITRSETAWFRSSRS